MSDIELTRISWRKRKNISSAIYVCTGGGILCAITDGMYCLLLVKHIDAKITLMPCSTYWVQHVITMLHMDFMSSFKKKFMQLKCNRHAKKQVTPTLMAHQNENFVYIL